MSSAAGSVNHPAYYADYRALRAESGGPDWLNGLRAAAWARFDAAGFPTARRGNEPWKYTSVAPIARSRFVHPVGGGRPQPGGAMPDGIMSFPADGGHNLVFRDGRYWPAAGEVANGDKPAGDKGVVIAPLAAALAAEPEIVRRYLGQLAPEADPFVALNTAFLADGAYVHLPEDWPEEVVLHIAYFTEGAAANDGDGGESVDGSGRAASVTYPRTLIVAGRNTRLTLLESYIGPGGDGGAGRYFTNAVTEVAVGAGAQVQHYRLLAESRDAFHVGTTRVVQAQDSSYVSGSFARGMALGRHDLSVLLDGTGAYCALNGLYLTDDTQHLDNLVSIDHARPNGVSRLYYKGILDGRSKAVFGGTVLVRADAQKTDAQQTDKNLILSDRAEVDSKPSLLIYADDVKCGHGATAGHIDAEALFYMQSRGLDPRTASQLLIQAFAREIIDTVSNAAVRDYLDGRFQEVIADKTLPAAGRLGGGA